MKIESLLQPNCSELGCALNTLSVEEAVNNLRDNGFKVNLYFMEKSWSDLPAKTLELFLNRFNRCSSQAGSQLEAFAALKDLPKELHKALLYDNEEGNDPPELLVEYKGKEVHFQIGDYCGGGDNPTVQIRDCDTEFFNVFYALEKKGLGEVYTIDGGYDDNYVAYKNKRGKE